MFISFEDMILSFGEPVPTKGMREKWISPSVKLQLVDDLVAGIEIFSEANPDAKIESATYEETKTLVDMMPKLQRFSLNPFAKLFEVVGVEMSRPIRSGIKSVSFLSIAETCNYLGCTEPQLQEFVRTGKLREFRDGGRIIYKLSDLQELTNAKES